VSPARQIDFDAFADDPASLARPFSSIWAASELPPCYCLSKQARMQSRLCPEELRMAHKILDAEEIKAALAKLPDWSVNGANIEAKFAFQGFRDAISFIVQIAIEAEVMNHHPEFHNSWNIVSFSFCTHDVGNKITDADIAIAAKISEAARRFISMK
jgi:4a-hydroxytetrahydrobiopterin dehydratase